VAQFSYLRINVKLRFANPRLRQTIRSAVHCADRQPGAIDDAPVTPAFFIEKPVSNDDYDSQLCCEQKAFHE
jgi:hypothetical protein